MKINIPSSIRVSFQAVERGHFNPIVFDDQISVPDKGEFVQILSDHSNEVFVEGYVRHRIWSYDHEVPIVQIILGKTRKGEKNEN